MRHYELMVILGASLYERPVQPSLETFLNVIRSDGGSVEKIEVWGKRRLAYEINKNAEGIYAVLEVACEPATGESLVACALGASPPGARSSTGGWPSPSRCCAQGSCGGSRSARPPRLL